jgi:1-acyl-sn-glycerol-3-phosphate acyltransferase
MPRVAGAPETRPGRSPRHGRATLPGPHLESWRRSLRYYLTRGFCTLLTGAFVRVRLEGLERYPEGPAVLCFNHLCWLDPFILAGSLPLRPRLFFFGPREEDMGSGGRNRIMTWTGQAVPYKPGKNDLLEVTRRVQAVFDFGGVLAIAGEGRIHAHEDELTPLSEGPAYFAMRSGVPLVPLAINGTSWVRFGRTVRIRIGQPILPRGRPSRDAVDAMTAQLQRELHALVQGYPDPPAPGAFGRWLTERFNEWPDGRRPAGPTPGAIGTGEAIGAGQADGAGEADGA